MEVAIFVNGPFYTRMVQLQGEYFGRMDQDPYDPTAEDIHRVMRNVENTQVVVNVVPLAPDMDPTGRMLYEGAMRSLVTGFVLVFSAWAEPAVALDELGAALGRIERTKDTDAANLDAPFAVVGDTWDRDGDDRPANPKTVAAGQKFADELGALFALASTRKGISEPIDDLIRILCAQDQMVRSPQTETAIEPVFFRKSVSIKDINNKSAPALVRALAKSRKIRVLELVQPSLRPAALQSVLSASPTLQELSIVGARHAVGMRGVEPSEAVRILRIERCKLEDTRSAAIARLAQLRELHLPGCKAGPRLGKMIKNLLSWANTIEVIDVSDNKLGTEGFETIVMASVTMTQAWASDNATMSPLRVLCVAKNGIKAVPPQITMLAALEEMDLSGNRIRSLPAKFDEMARLGRLKRLNGQGNPWQTPPPELMDRTSVNLKRVTEFLTALRLDGGVECHSSRLLFVGLGEVGKTALQRALRDERANKTEPIGADDRTVGIDTFRWRPLEGQGLEFRVWDFAGQAVYQASHQLFLTPRVLFVLVVSLADKRGLETMLAFWLDTLNARVPGATVLLVATHGEAAHEAVSADFCARAAEVVQGFVSARAKDQRDAVGLKLVNGGVPLVVDSVTGLGISAARSAVVAAGQQLPHMGETIPASWTEVLSVLRRMAPASPPPLVTVGEVSAAVSAAVASSANMEASVGSALWLWHELGEVFVHKDLVVLDPQWILELVKVFVSHEASSTVRYHHREAMELLETRGILERGLVKPLLEGVVPAPLMDDMLGLLESFEILYKLDEERFVVPALLPAGQWNVDDEADWPLWQDGERVGHSALIEFRFMPAGVFSRTALRAHALRAWTREEHHASFARFAMATGGRLLLELEEKGAQVQQVVLHARGPNSWELLWDALIQMQDLVNNVFVGCNGQVRSLDGASIPWTRLTSDRLLVARPEPRESQEPVAGADESAHQVMISYKHGGSEGELVVRIKEGLDAEPDPLCVWIDYEGIVGGAIWRRAIARAIQRARLIVFALSQRAVSSAFCEEELCLAARLGKPVLPVLVGPLPTRAEYRPQMLRLVGLHVQFLDFVSRPFPEALGELSMRARVLAAEPAARPRAPRAAPTALPRAPEGSTAVSAPHGSVFVSHAPEDHHSAHVLCEWLSVIAGMASVSTLGIGESVGSPARQAALEGCDLCIAIVTRSYVESAACWQELNVWEGLASPTLVPVAVEDVGAGWRLAEMELLLARHEADGVVLHGVADPAGALEQLCALVASRVRAPGDRVGDQAEQLLGNGQHVVTHTAGADIGDIVRLQRRIRLLEDRDAERVEQMRAMEERMRAMEERMRAMEERELERDRELERERSQSNSSSKKGGGSIFRRKK